MSETLIRPEAAVLSEGISVAPIIRIAGGVVKEITQQAVGANSVKEISGTLLPGLIDLQVNGAGGRGVDEADREALERVAEQVSAGGAAAFLPTLISTEFEELLEQIAAVAGWIEDGPRLGARPLGIHVEGPFLEIHGAHDPGAMLDPSKKRVQAILNAGKGQVRLLTLAPELPGAPEAVAHLRQAGVTVALGHGAAGSQLEACVDAGASLVTHLFNATGEDHHRRPGLASIAMDEERLSCTLIPDGHHVHPVALRNAYRCLGMDRFILVTDSVAAAGMPDGEYHLAGASVRLEAGIVRNAAGGLAGSALSMGEAGENFLRWFPHLGPWSLAKAASSNPARAIGAANWGSIAPGKAAQFALLSSAGKLSSVSF